MPKLKPSKREEQNRHARAVLMDYLVTKGYETADALSECCGFSVGTARNRFKAPDEMKISELRRLDLTDEQIVRMVRGEVPKKQAVNVYINGVKYET